MAGQHKSGASGQKRATNSSSATKGWPDVWIRLIDAAYDLASTGNIIGLVVFVFGACLFVVTWRVPSEDFGKVGAFLAGESFYLFPLSLALAVSLITNIIQAKVYKSHIVTLAENRNNIVHGLQSGELTKLKNHYTSGFDLQSGNSGNSTGGMGNADI